MGTRLLPLTMVELCAHALELERDAAERCHEYAGRMRDLGEDDMADVLEAFESESRDEMGALKVASEGHELPELSPWEYAWRLTYMPEALENGAKVVPLSAREALQLTLLARRRAEAFYNDVAENSTAPVVRACAAEMGTSRHEQVQRLERLLASQIRIETALASARGDDSRLPS